MTLKQISLSLGWIALSFSCSLEAQEPADPLSKVELNKLNQLEVEFSLELLNLEESRWIEPMRTLRANYQKRMVQLQNEFTQKGELSKAVIARDSAREDPSPDKIITQIPQVASLQNIFLRQQEKIKKRHDQARRNIGRQHVTKLKSISSKLSKASRLEAALEVQKLITKATDEVGGLLSDKAGIPEAPDFSKGLLAYYPFNGDTNDESGNERHARSVGATLAKDRFGTTNSAYSFDGNSNYIIGLQELPDSKHLSVSAWIEPAKKDGRASIFYDAAFFTPGRDTALAVEDGNNLKATFTKNSSANPGSLLAEDALKANTWTHIVLTMGPDGAKLFINGLPDAESEVVSHNVGFHSKPYFGAENHGARVEYFFGGKIDDIRIYDRALSDSEVKRFYSYEKNTRPSKLRNDDADKRPNPLRKPARRL